MAEKMDEDAEREKTFKYVDSPNSDSEPRSPVLDTVRINLEGATLPMTTAPGLYSSDSAAFPASSAGPLSYPQSPLHTWLQ